MSLAEIPAGERGVLRVFAVNLDAQAAQHLQSTGATGLAQLLGVDTLNTDYVEMFRIADLGELGLDDYLHTGYDVPRSALEAQTARLRALEGYALIVLSLAFEPEGATLPATADLTLIATFGDGGPDWSTDSPLLSSTAAEPHPTGKKPPSEAAILGRVATFALLFLFALTALMVWIAA